MDGWFIFCEHPGWMDGSFFVNTAPRRREHMAEQKRQNNCSAAVLSAEERNETVNPTVPVLVVTERRAVFTKNKSNQQKFIAAVY